MKDPFTTNMLLLQTLQVYSHFDFHSTRL